MMIDEALLLLFFIVISIIMLFIVIVIAVIALSNLLVYLHLDVSLQDGENSAASSVRNAAVPDNAPSDGVTKQDGLMHSMEIGDSSLCTIANNQKSKKHKKDKLRHADHTEVSSKDVVEPDVSAGICHSLTKAETKKKRKNHQEDVVSAEGNILCEHGDKNVVQPDVSAAVSDNLTKYETKRKRKKQQEDVVNGEMNILCENGDKNEAVVEDSVCKQKKSAKKRQCKGDGHSDDESRDVRNTNDDFGKQSKTADGKNFSL